MMSCVLLLIVCLDVSVFHQMASEDGCAAVVECGNGHVAFVKVGGLAKHLADAAGELVEFQLLQEGSQAGLIHRVETEDGGKVAEMAEGRRVLAQVVAQVEKHHACVAGRLVAFAKLVFLQPPKHGGGSEKRGVQGFCVLGMTQFKGGMGLLVKLGNGELGFGYPLFQVGRDSLLQGEEMDVMPLLGGDATKVEYVF